MQSPARDAAYLWLILVSRTGKVLTRGSAPLEGTHFVHLRKSDAIRRYTRILATDGLQFLDVSAQLNSLI